MTVKVLLKVDISMEKKPKSDIISLTGGF